MASACFEMAPWYATPHHDSNVQYKSRKRSLVGDDIHIEKRPRVKSSWGPTSSSSPSVVTSGSQSRAWSSAGTSSHASFSPMAAPNSYTVPIESYRQPSLIAACQSASHPEQAASASSMRWHMAMPSNMLTAAPARRHRPIQQDMEFSGLLQHQAVLGSSNEQPVVQSCPAYLSSSSLLHEESRQAVAFDSLSAIRSSAAEVRTSSGNSSASSTVQDLFQVCIGLTSQDHLPYPESCVSQSAQPHAAACHAAATMPSELLCPALTSVGS